MNENGQDAAVEALDLDAIRARADAATPGPWSESTPGTVARIGGNGRTFGVVGLRGVRAADAEFITHARTDVPALVVELSALREQSRGLDETVEWGVRYRLYATGENDGRVGCADRAAALRVAADFRTSAECSLAVAEYRTVVHRESPWAAVGGAS